MSFENDIAAQVETLLHTITGSARPDSEKRQILRLINAATQLVSGDSSSLVI
jgi:hypothetical protein